MSAQPGNDFGVLGKDDPEPAPKLSIEPLRGFRMWYAQPTGDLKSISFACFWTPGWNYARCLKTVQYKNADECAKTLHPGMPFSHTPDCAIVAGGCDYPRAKCGCGFYAFFDRAYWGATDSVTVVTGVIEGIGRCVIGPRGFRAERARILALRPASEKHISAITDRYHRIAGIPIYSNETEMLAAFPLTGPPARGA